MSRGKLKWITVTLKPFDKGNLRAKAAYCGASAFVDAPCPTDVIRGLSVALSRAMAPKVNQDIDNVQGPPQADPFVPSLPSRNSN